MIKTDFLYNQPHPETDETACINLSDAAESLRPALDFPVRACGGAFAGGNFLLFAVEEAEAFKVRVYSGKEPGSLGEGREFAVFGLPVTGLSCYEDDTGGGVCVCAGEIYLFNMDGTQRGNIPVTAFHASVLREAEGFWLAYDGKLARVSEDLDGFKDDPVEIRARPFYLSKSRQDALSMQGRDHPGLRGGCLFKHGNRYYYICADRFTRCAVDNIDTFCCSTEKLTGYFDRRYLIIPSGGIANLFHDDKGRPYAVFRGSSAESVVYGKAAILPLEWKEEGFFRPGPGYILEKNPVNFLRIRGGINEIRDTFVFNAPDGWYYLTGTTREQAGTYWKSTAGVTIWRSRDLKDFELVGRVFDYRGREDSWQRQVSNNMNSWAPEITFYNNTFWITYSTAPGCGLLKSLSGKIEGPYADMGRYVIKGIDSGFYLEGETLYLIWQNGRIAPLTRTCNSFAEEPKLLMPSDGQQVGYEGAGLIKVRDKYILYAAEWNGDARIDGSYDMMYSVADKLEGPYSPRRILVPHGGHGCLFFDKENRLCYTIFGNDRSAPFRHGAGIGLIRNCKIIKCYTLGEMI
ncbi:MAG: family 43 glycosylhydrolase [Treponema sp.]|jgi:hypothetical protein|nr:family 43 glycosylhydrolase [Treponema sp.]